MTEPKKLWSTMSVEERARYSYDQAKRMLDELYANNHPDIFMQREHHWSYLWCREQELIDRMAMLTRIIEG
jgi:hypothetical protein